MANKIENSTKKGHYEVQFEDGYAGVAMYDKTLDDVVRTLARLDRVVKSIEWIEDVQKVED